MKPRRLILAMCISVMAASAHCAALLTRDEHVVFASGHPRVPRNVDPTPIPLEPIKLKEMRVRSEVALRYARTSVITHVHNPDTRPQEASFRMLLPDTAFISGFTMILSGQSYKAYVKEKQEAKHLYTQAVSQGISAAHVATKARDSNHFTVTVNVEGNTTAVFDLRYEDFLVSRHGLYSHVINLHPGALVPTMEVVVHIKESQKITKLHVPDLRTGNEIDATQIDSHNSKVVIQNGTNEREVTITFTPDLLEQRRLAKIYMDKSKADGTSFALGQFVVEYDVERPNNGEILVNDGYFVHFLAPTSLPPLSKLVVFVLDTSGSMTGRKIEQLRKAMDTILSDLNPNDYFSIVEFSHFVKVHELKEADEPAPPQREYWYYNTISTDAPYDLVPPALASPENIAKAKIIVSRLDYTGGTNIYGALDAAINIVKKGVDQKNENVTSNSDIAIKNVKKIDVELEPIIIFLTDGVSVDGETNTDRITSLITEKNSGDIRAALYTIAFGEDADRVFLRKLSLRNEGFMRHIYEAADASLQLHDFYRQVASPLLSHVQFLYPANQIKEGSVSRNQFRAINSGSEVAVVGKIADDVTEITPRIFGFYGSEDGLSLKRYEVTTQVTVTRTKNEYLPLERLWAYFTIKQLLDKRDAGDDLGTDENSLEKKALAIALKYAFVTPLTSLVVVKPNETNAVDVESADASSITTTTPASTTTAAQPPPRYNWKGTSVDTVYDSGFTRTFGGVGRYGGNGDWTDRSGSIRSRSNGRSFSYRNNLISGYGAFDYDRSYGNRVFDSSDEYDSGSVRNSNRIIYGDLRPPTHNLRTSYGRSYNGVNAFVTTTAGTTTSTTSTTQAPTTAADVNDHLGGFEWTSSILNSSTGALTVLGENGTQVFLELATDINPPKADGGDGECSNSTSTSAVGANENAGSVCVYLTRCYTARSITADDYQKSFCVVNNRYAGVCCPSDEVDRNPV